MLKKTLIGFGILLVVVIGGALIAPSFIDWNARLPEIVAQVKATTGRDLTVDGRLEVSLLPAPMLTARGVKLGNAPGGASPYLVALEAVEVRVALLPLLSGQVQVERIRLVKPQVNIETFADGSTNLEFQAAPDAAMPPSSVQNGASQIVPAGTDNAASGSGLGLRLDHFEIIDATIVYQDAEGTIERIEGLNTTLRAASLQGPFEAQGDARLRNVPVSFEVSLGQIISGRTIPTMTARINAPGGTRVNISGTVLEMEVAPRFKGKVKAEGADVAALLNAVTSARGARQPQSQPLSQSFTLDADVNATARDVALSELELTLGDMRATGLIDVGLVDGVTFNVDLNASRIDADAWMAKMPARSSASAESSSVAAAQPATTEEARGADAPQGFALPTGVNGIVSLNIDAVTFKGGLVSNVRINAELADGELALSQFQLQAPGVTDVGLFGFIKPEGGQVQFNGDLEIVTADPKGLTEWLGVQMPDSVAGRLKRLTFKSKVVADQAQVVMSGIDLNGDRTHVTGGVTVALRARPSFGADLNVDALNLDTYANGNGSNGATAGAAAPAVTEQPEAKSQMAQAMDMAGMWAATSALNTFDANLKVRLGSLTRSGRVFKDVLFDGTLYTGALELRQFRVGETLGASATVNGNFKGFGGVPEMTGVQAEVKVRDANTTAAALGVAGLPANMGAATLNVRADGSLLKPSLNAKMAALGGDFGAVGRVSLLTGFAWDGDVSAQHPNTVKLLAALGYVPAGPLGAMDVKAKLKTDGATHEVTALQGNIGETSLAGTLTAKTGGAKPNVVANLSTGAFDIQRFLAQAEKRADAAPSHNPLLVLASTRTDPQLAQTSSRADKRWSREKFDLSVLNSMDGELTLKSDAIQFGDYRLDNADIHATVSNGVMTADRVVGQLFGGPVSGTAVVRASGQPTVESTIKLSAMEVGRAVMAVAGKDLATGNLGLDMNLSATGSSPADLVSSLNGAGGMKIDSLDAKQGGTGTALAPVIGLVAAMNQFALPAVGGAGKSKGGLADLSLGFDIKDGIATAKNLALNAAFGSGAGSGTVDIAAWLIDFSGNLTVEPNLLSTLISKGRMGKQEVPFTLKGALDKPGVNLGVRSAGSAPAAGGASTDPVKSLLNQVLPGVIPQPQQPQAQPQDGSLPPPPTQDQAPAQKKLTPEQMIKQLMKGL
ncbi:MAG: AsmA family protein [Rhodospirillales bacterium]|nr:AsmA family protein [Rhodospirillales bacterium]